jgi:uncharacterized protein with PQ loop repeat
MNSPFENLPENKSFYSIIKLSADILMIFIPPIGYIFQALKFKQTKSSKGFAKFLCLLLLLANILRIFFWFGKKFSLPLLFQAILVIISQIYLIHAYLEYQEDLPMKTEKTFREYLTNWKETLNLKKIWDWNDEIEYFKFILFIILILSIICSIFGTKNIQFFEILGALSVSCETFIELPQIKENCMAKNTKNLSGAMVLMWFVGDLFKTTYNLMYKSPIQMIIGGIIMNCEDIILSSQVLFYNEDSFLNKVFQKRPKYVNLDEVKDSEQNNKLDFDTNIG